MPPVMLLPGVEPDGGVDPLVVVLVPLPVGGVLSTVDDGMGVEVGFGVRVAVGVGVGERHSPKSLLRPFTFAGSGMS